MAAPVLHVFHINPIGEPNIIVEGNDWFCHSHEVHAYKAWAEAEIARLTTLTAPPTQVDTAEDALWTAIHEALICAWNLLDGTENDASGVDQSDWDDLSNAMTKLGELVPESEQPFSPSYAAPYLRKRLTDLTAPPAQAETAGGSPVVIKGQGFNHRGGGFEKLIVNGVDFTAQEVATALAAHRHAAQAGAGMGSCWCRASRPRR